MLDTVQSMARAGNSLILHSLLVFFNAGRVLIVISVSFFPYFYLTISSIGDFDNVHALMVLTKIDNKT